MLDVFDRGWRKIAALREIFGRQPSRAGFWRKIAALREIFGRNGPLKASLTKNCSIAWDFRQHLTKNCSIAVNSAWSDLVVGGGWNRKRKKSGRRSSSGRRSKNSDSRIYRSHSVLAIRLFLKLPSEWYFPVYYENSFTGYYYVVFKAYLAFYRLEKETMLVDQVLTGKSDYMRILRLTWYRNCSIEQLWAFASVFSSPYAAA